MFKKFYVKDIVFLAILAAAMTLAGGCTMPLVMHTTIFGLRNMVGAPLYSMFAVIGLMKVRKTGTMTIIGIFSGFPLVFMAPVMFFNNFLAGLMAEILCIIIFRGYEKKASIIFTCGMFMPLSLPVTILFSMWLNGTSFADVLGNTGNLLWTVPGTFVLGFAGAFLGMKISKELQKAGKLKPYTKKTDEEEETEEETEAEDA